MKVLLLYSTSASSLFLIIFVATCCITQAFDSHPPRQLSSYSLSSSKIRRIHPSLPSSSRLPRRASSFVSFTDIKPGAVRFSRVKPIMTSQYNNEMFSRINHEQSSLHHQNWWHQTVRRKRFSVGSEVSRRSPEDVCKSVSDWVLKVSVQCIIYVVGDDVETSCRHCLADGSR